MSGEGRTGAGRRAARPVAASTRSWAIARSVAVSGRRQPAAVVGAMLVLAGVLVWAAWNVLETEVRGA